MLSFGEIIVHLNKDHAPNKKIELSLFEELMAIYETCI